MCSCCLSCKTIQDIYPSIPKFFLFRNVLQVPHLKNRGSQYLLGVQIQAIEAPMLIQLDKALIFPKINAYKTNNLLYTVHTLPSWVKVSSWEIHFQSVPLAVFLRILVLLMRTQCNSLQSSCQHTVNKECYFPSSHL